MRGKKKTYFYSALFAVLFFLAVGGLGVEEGYLYEEELETQVEEEDVSLHGVPYGKYFAEYAELANCDWQLLAAIARHESRYNPLARNASGARGMMQIMPKVAHSYGLNDSTIYEAKDNIEVGARVVGKLQHIFRFIPNKNDRIKFALASYNAGPAHVLDGRRLAQQNGANYNSWDECAYWMEQLDNELYYNDTVILYGAFNARPTVRYVNATWATYQRIKSQTEQQP